MSLLKENAYPLVNGPEGFYQAGLNKIEIAALMIAQGLVSKYNLSAPTDQKIIAELSCQLATEILYEANKAVYK